MLILKLIRRHKTQEQVKREEIVKLANTQLREIMKIGMGFPVIAYKL
jgi:hypothetical protein